MNTRLFRLMGLFLPALLALLPAVPRAEPGPRWARPAASEAEDASNARVIVKYRADAALMRALSARDTAPARPQHAAALSQRLALPLADGPALGARMQALRGRGLSSTQLAARLAAQPDVEWAVPDLRRRLLALPNDPYFGDNLGGGVTPTAGQWYLRAPTASTVSAVNAVGAWDFTIGSPALTVAVLDTGVRFDHPDLAGKLLPGYDFINDLTTANDGNGRDADASDPGDWSNAGECDAGEPASSSSWHGTQVAGLIGAASDNGQGIAGTARNVKILPVRVLGRCGGYDSDILAGMRWAAGLSADPVPNPNPARILNMSLGSSGPCLASYRDTVAELNAAGIVVVIAGGNATGLAVSTPANCAGAVAVAGVRHTGTKVGYSNVGPEMTLAAPAGNCVNTSGACLYPLLTTTNSGSTAPASNIYSDSFNYSVGTSFAAPIVAGTVALMMSLDPTLTPARAKATLQATVRPFPASGADAAVVACRAPTAAEQLECYCTTTTCGAGLLDAAAAVAKVRADGAPAPTVLISVSSAAPTAGASVTLGSAGTVAGAGRTIVAYQWSITAGSALAAFSGPTDQASATLVTSAAGNVTVQLTVTDSLGASSAATTTIAIAAAPVTPVTPSGGSGGGGGGAVSFAWLIGLAAALLLLRRDASIKR
ncbi:S8 family serine peptidase [Aquincola sp. S2]|uniref:S8 family serine peptidase n=1 Tax=Pseudaquabacterium terrae TaxID=2732868 RepID=A0ABX2EAU7_9BURK|nr:S8 family serine peptidase [Aquabacterium terrae]NRF66214.1 S8 family serine peptidase [Aquabacterium terrae]